MRWMLVLIAVTALLGCQRSPAPKVDGGRSGPTGTAAALVAEGHSFMSRADYRAALERYLKAATLEPGDISINFALGSAYSYLERHAEAIKQLKWVVKQADPRTLEYREALGWLRRVGVSTAARGTAGAPAPQASRDDFKDLGIPTPTPSLRVADRTADKPAPVQDTAGTGRVLGRSEWPKHGRSLKGDVSILGDEEVTRDVRRLRGHRPGDRFEFLDLPPGRYRVVVRVSLGPGDLALWDQKVTVLAGKPTELTLTPATSLVTPERFLAQTAQ